MKRAWRLARRIMLAPLRLVLALLILFEEWGWEPLQRAAERLMRWPGLRALERWIKQLPPWAALALLLVPVLTLLPLKILALWLLAQGHRVAGVALILAAKLTGTAVLARLFALTQPALMRLPWFAAGYGRWVIWKEALLHSLRMQPWWGAMQRWRLGFKRAARGLLRRLARFVPR